MTDNEFAPQTVVVDPGTVVRWVNVGRNKHDVIVDAKTPNWTSSKAIKAGKDYDHQFQAPGVYGYSCGFHGATHTEMYGTVIVRNADGTLPAIVKAQAPTRAPTAPRARSACRRTSRRSRPPSTAPHPAT